MNVKVAMPPSPPSMDMAAMNRDSNCSTPFISAPSSPQRPLNLFFYSAPTSPRSSSSFFQGGVDDGPASTSAVVPFSWESHSGVPRPSAGEDEGFEFDFGGQLDMMIGPSLSSADELFDGGKIRPLKPSLPMTSAGGSPRSPMSNFGGALSPKQRKNNFEDEDPFEAAFKNTTKSESEINAKSEFDDQNRGRSSKNPQNSRSNSRRKGIRRSLSPLRVSEFALLNHQELPPKPNQSSNNGGSRAGSLNWRLKDLLLFRSASEGRATIKGKDPLRKYFSLSMKAKKIEDDGKNCGSSFKSTASSSSSTAADVGSVPRRRGQVSEHERHYTANRAVAEEMKKKTSLPYKHGLLGCLGIGLNPAFHDISRAFKSFAP